MTETFYRRADLTYWGSSVGEHAEPPAADLYEVPFPPDTNAAQKWNGTGWDPYVPVLTIEQKLDQIFMAQPIPLQIMFAGPMALVEKYLLAGLIAEAQTVIQTVPIPAEVAAQAEPVRQQLLAQFQ